MLTAVAVLLISTVFAVAAAGKCTRDIDNGMYSVSVQGPINLYGEGTYTIATSSGHPVPAKNVLYGGVDHDPWSTYLTVRVYNTIREYVSTTTGPAPSHGYTLVALDDCAPDTVLNGNNIYIRHGPPGKGC